MSNDKWVTSRAARVTVAAKTSQERVGDFLQGLVLGRRSTIASVTDDNQMGRGDHEIPRPLIPPAAA